jgi:hypothetical protein
MVDHITPQERADYGRRADPAEGTAMSTLTNVPRRWRPIARLPGMPAALETMRAEDEIVRLLCSPDMSVSAQQATAAVELARRCAAVWVDTTRQMLAVGSRGMVYQLHSDDFAWLSEARAKYTEKSDDDTMQRLEQITDRIPWDAAAVASRNAARWLVRKHGGSVQLH